MKERPLRLYAVVILGSMVGACGEATPAPMTAEDPVDAGAATTADEDAGPPPATPTAAGAPPMTPDEDAGPGAPTPSERLDGLVAEVAAATCDALFRCCDDTDVEGYFAPHRDSPSLEAIAPRLPPNMPLDAAGCPAVMEEIFAIVPFGGWVDAARAGEVGFDEAAYDACLDTLRTASCGDEVRAALYDGTCLAYNPPLGGDDQRRMFSRTASDGAPCGPIRDGIGAGFFGTCDPTTSFCCFTDPANPDIGCTFAYDGDGVPREGVCRPAGGEGDACDGLPPLSICRTGLECADGTCVAPSTATLAVGETCVDEGFMLLGDCDGGYCDLFGSSVCEPLEPDGAECTAPYECQSGSCVEGACAAPTFCTGD